MLLLATCLLAVVAATGADRQADYNISGAAAPYPTVFGNTHYGAQVKLAKNADILVVSEISRGYNAGGGSGIIHIYVPIHSSSSNKVTWTEVQNFTAGLPQPSQVKGQEYYGQTVEISDDGSVIMVGAPAYPYLAPGYSSWDVVHTNANGLPGKNARGAVFMYTRSNDPSVSVIPQYNLAQMLQVPTPETFGDPGMRTTTCSYPADACHTMSTDTDPAGRLPYREQFGQHIAMSADGAILFIGSCSETPMQKYGFGKYMTYKSEGVTVSRNQGVHVFVRNATSSWTFSQTVSSNETSNFGPECQSFAINDDATRLIMRGRPDVYTNDVKYFALPSAWTYPTASTSKTASNSPSTSVSSSSSTTPDPTYDPSASGTPTSSASPSITSTPKWEFVQTPLIPTAPYPQFPSTPTWTSSPTGAGVPNGANVAQYWFGMSIYYGKDGQAFFSTPKINDKVYALRMADSGPSYVNMIEAGIDVVYAYGSTASFGHSMDQYDDLLVVGAPLDVGGSAQGKGATYVYMRDAGGNSWTKVDAFTGSSLAEKSTKLNSDIIIGQNDYFGICVSVNYGWIVVGAPMDGQVHIFENTYWPKSVYVATPAPPRTTKVVVIDPPPPPNDTTNITVGLIVGLILLCCLLILLFLLLRYLLKRRMRKKAEERKKRQEQHSDHESSMSMDSTANLAAPAAASPGGPDSPAQIVETEAAKSPAGPEFL